MKNHGKEQGLSAGFKKMSAEGGKSSDHMEKEAYSGVVVTPSQPQKTNIQEICYEGHKGRGHLYSGSKSK